MSEFTPETIFENLLFSTVKINSRYSNGNKGSGTGFIFSYDIEKDKSLYFIITNKHVIENSEHGKILFHVRKINHNSALLGESITIEMDEFEKGWIKHENNKVDIAAMVITKRMIDIVRKKDRDLFFKSIPNSLILTGDDLKSKVDAIEDVIFIGYPKGLYDKKNLMPIVRKGTTATPINIDFEGKPQFLIDGSVYPGSSGSPVFICNIGNYSGKGGRMVIGNRIIFVGVLSAMKTYPEGIDFVEFPAVKIPGMYSSQLLNLGIVYKSKLINEIIQKIIDEKLYKF